MIIKHKHGKLIAHSLGDGAWYIDNITVDPEHRREGTGTWLMQTAIERINARPIYLYATDELGTDLRALKRFYRQFGFKPVPKSIQRQLDYFPLIINMSLGLD